eukprot:scaffold8346_cov119-Isochrysis_galbana.AAC.5
MQLQDVACARLRGVALGCWSGCSKAAWCTPCGPFAGPSVRAGQVSFGVPASAAPAHSAAKAGLRVMGAVGSAAIESGAWNAARQRRSRSRCSEDLALSRTGSPRLSRDGIVRIKLKSPGRNSTLSRGRGEQSRRASEA